METEVKSKPILSHLRNIFNSAHSGTSFSPEVRAEQSVNSYSEMLEDDLKLLGDKCGNYKEKFISKLTDWQAAKSRCISSMITGGSNFPVRRAQKANRSEQNKGEAFYAWRERYFTAVNRVPTKSPEEEIEVAEKKLEALLNFQLEAKEINAAIREMKIKTVKEAVSYLLGEAYDPNVISCISDNYGRKISIPSYYLTNNNARIKSTKDKVITMNNRIARKDTWEDIVFEGGYVTIEDDRLKIFHDDKPSREIINEIKSNGYRWSPNWVCWCRKHTENAIWSLRNLSFIPKKQ